MKLDVNRLITQSRLSSYTSFSEYKDNLLLSKHYYVPLSILEVALRNSIDNYLQKNKGTDWTLKASQESQILGRFELKAIDEAKNKIIKRHEIPSHDKIIAELNFGFWTGLFTNYYRHERRISDLNKIFPNLPSKKIRLVDRIVIYNTLDLIRRFRNRIFHYEKIINKREFSNIAQDIDFILTIMDPMLKKLSERMNKYS